MSISYSFNKAQASALRNVSSNFGVVNSNVKNLINNMDSFFRGAAANACKEAFQRRQNEVERLRSEASRIASEINQAVADIREEERERRRSHGGGGGGRVSSGGPGV